MINVLEILIFFGCPNGQIIELVLIPDKKEPAFSKDSFSNIKGERLEYLDIKRKIIQIFEFFSRKREMTRI
jgi:hypothetical protein